MTRRRFVYTEGGRPLSEPYEVTDEWSDAPKPTGDGLKFELEQVQGMHGERFSTAGQFSRYLTKNDLALHSDTASHVAKKQAERAAAFTPGAGYDSARRREDIGRAMYQLQQKGRRK
jgi:hypothetical protein